MKPRRLLFLCAGLAAVAPCSAEAATAATAPAAASRPALTAVPVTAAALHAYAAEAEHELRGDILPFWLRHAPDRRHGGFVGRIGQDMTVDPDAPRGVLLTSRILWTFSAAYRRFHDPAYLAMAERAYAELTAHGFDPKEGGLYWTVGPDGRPVDAGKLLYGQAFGIYGLAEYYRATGDPRALHRAIELYRLVEAKAHDRVHGGYFEAFDRDWRRDPVRQRRIMGAPAPKSQNAHIHLLEAYTNLLRVWPDAGLRANQRALFELMVTRILNPQTHHLTLFFRDDWTPVSDVVSYGHDIELSWLLVEAADVLGDPALERQARTEAVAIARGTAAQGVDRDGGVFNEAGPHGLIDPNKDWWPQAEATVGFLNAYQISGDPAFFAASRHTWHFIETTLIDRRYGDWFESVTRAGAPRRRSKLSVWKCPYHNSRACLQIIERADALAAARAAGVSPGPERPAGG